MSGALNNDSTGAGLQEENFSVSNNSKPADQKPLIVAFCCNWCSYAGGDLAGTSRMTYPANVKVIRVPCSSRMNPMFVIRAFQRGADGVLIAGCHPGDCHYSTGNYHVRRRFSAFKRLVEFAGIEPERFEIRWISSSEGNKFAEEMTAMTEKIKALGPNRKMRDARWQSTT
ncbi:MAG: hydrogenase iron-sulfur subunit [Bacillota bacterium]